MDSFKLKNWIIDVKSHRIRVEGVDEVDAIVLQKQAMDELVYFSNHPVRLITTEQLIRALYADIEVDKAHLGKTIQALVNAFGDHSKEPQIIEVIPKVGYKLLTAPQPFHSLETNTTEQVANNQTQQVTTALNRKRLAKFLVFFGIVLILAIIGLSRNDQGALSQNASSLSRQSSQSIPRLAVLPFTNTSGDTNTSMMIYLPCIQSLAKISPDS